MKQDYNIDPKILDDIKIILQKQLGIKEKTEKLVEKIVQLEYLLEDDMRGLMFPKQDLLELFSGAVFVFKLAKMREEAEKYEDIYNEYMTSNIYEEKAEAALLSVENDKEITLIIRKNLRDAYLASGDKENADIQEVLINELLE